MGQVTGAVQTTVTHAPVDTSWHSRGACTKADPELFYHPPGETGYPKERRIQAAKAICDQCPVKALCRTWALEAREDFGTWGGLSEEDRAAIRAGKTLAETTRLQVVPYAIGATDYIDPDAVSRHVAMILDAGFSATALARFTGVAVITITKISQGGRKKVYPGTAQKLLSVQLRAEEEAVA